MDLEMDTADILADDRKQKTGLPCKVLFGSALFRVHVAAACVQILYAAFQILAKVALSSGTSRSVFPVYRNAIAALVLAPFAFFYERRIRPRLTLMKLSQLFLCGFIGVCMNQTLFLAGLYYTSATFTATLQNLTPALTFAISASLGIEQLRIERREGQAKALGVLLGVSGATLIALYKGPAILSLSAITNGQLTAEVSSFISWRLGVLCLLGNCVTLAIWLIIQNPILKDYPAQLSATALTYFFGSIQLALIAAYAERDIDVWIATFYSDLPAILYAGVVASGLAMTLQGWCAYQGGPVLVAAYQPLQTIFVALLSSTFIGESFYMGSLLGGFIIITGLYLVVWGNSMEKKAHVVDENTKGISKSETSSKCEQDLKEPLLDDGRFSNETLDSGCA